MNGRIDITTGEHVVWFFGTTLSSIYVNIPRYLWRLPRHSGTFQFDTLYESDAGHFPLLHRLSVLSIDQPLPLHSALLQPEIEFTIYLPSTALKGPN